MTPANGAHRGASGIPVSPRCPRISSRGGDGRPGSPKVVLELAVTKLGCLALLVNKMGLCLAASKGLARSRDLLGVRPRTGAPPSAAKVASACDGPSEKLETIVG
eukprot:1316249-Pyramimonas_sp.AAC.1